MLNAKMITLAITLILFGCNHRSNKQVHDIPQHVDQLKNLTIHFPGTLSADTVELTRVAVFESNEEIFLDGYIGQLAIDDSGRVYIGSSSASKAGIYVFNPDGSYFSTIGKTGRGPGEFKAIGSMNVKNSQLYLFDPILQKFLIWSIDDYELIHEALINKKKAGRSNSLVNQLRGDDLMVTEDKNLLIGLSALALDPENDENKILYCRISFDGIIQPNPVIELERFAFYFPKNNELKLPVTMPFTRSSLLANTREGFFFTAWTEDFLIKIYDKNGNYLRAFYYPVEKSNLSLGEMDISSERQRVLDNYEMPENWPALHAMKADNEGNLWVATITDDETSYKWWVLNREGELLARFTFSGQRSARNVMSEPVMKIKDGYFYAHEFDFHEEVDRIVKYEIEINPK